MSLLVALIFAQAASELALPPQESDIVVLAQKLKRTKFVWKVSDKSGSWRLVQCKIKKSSGDKAVDAITCKAIEQCLPVMPVGAKAAPPAYYACVTERRNALIEELAAQRAAEADART